LPAAGSSSRIFGQVSASLWRGGYRPVLKALSAACIIALGATPVAPCGQQVSDPPQVTSDGSANVENLQQNYLIGVGDLLDIKLFYNPELNEQVTVRPDGLISLQLANEISAAGLTPGQLRESLMHTYASQLKNPELTVIVRSFNSQKLFVDGEVSHPGLLTLSGPTTVLEAISQAGGFKDTARRKEVLIIRRSGQKQPNILMVNADHLLKPRYADQDITLQPYDVVYVPKSRIANLNQWVEQYITKNLPATFTFGFFSNVNAL
jgi:polysaccharide export outer membrane protein